MNRVTVKKGDTFSAVCQYNDKDGNPINLVTSAVTVTSQVRLITGEYLADLTVTILDQTTNKGKYELKADTSLWPVGALSWDIQYSQGGVVSSTDTITISVVSGVTV